MARAREFDEVTAPEAEIECFWHRGDEAASVRHLADKMGISEPSLYNAYGDKRALFAQALDHHVDHSARALIKRLESSLPPKQAVRRFIEEIVERSVNDRERRGCFLINSALEVAPHDRQLGALIADRLAEIEAVFYRSIKAAQAEGAIRQDRVAKRSRALAARRFARHSSSRPFKARAGPARGRRAPCARPSRLKSQQGAA